MRRTVLFGAIAIVMMSWLTLGAGPAHAQNATFSRFNDAAARCYDPATTAPDPLNPNLLRIGMSGCSASSPNGTVLLMDTFSFFVDAPQGYFVSKITFSQNGASGGSRGGTGFIGTTLVVDKKASTANVVDLSLDRKRSVQVSVTTFLAAFGIQVVSGFATALNPTVLVELAPL